MSRTLPRSILVTGSFRSGSTWLGRMIASHPRLAYLSEPLNVRQPPSPVRHFLPYVTPDNEAAFREYLHGLLTFRDPALYQVTEPTWKRWPRRLGRRLRCRWHRLCRSRPLVKDPTAFFAADWLAATFGMRVIILIRHPAAFASSLKRLHWHFDFNDFLAQPELMRDVLWPFEDAIHQRGAQPAGTNRSGDPALAHLHAQAIRYEQAIRSGFLSATRTCRAGRKRSSHNSSPRLGLRLSRKTRTILERHTRTGNPREAGAGVVHELAIAGPTSGRGPSG